MSGIDGYGSFSLDNIDINDLFAAMADGQCKPEESLKNENVGEELEFNENSFIWEDVKLSDGSLSLPLSQPLMDPVCPATTPIPAVTKQELMSPSPPITVVCTEANIPDIDILQTAMTEIPASPYASECSESESETARYHSHPLVAEYGLTDDSLSDMSLKKLRSLCRGDNDHFDQLKAYRRTCLNRHYARSSRAKTQKKTMCMSSELENAKRQISRLTKENSDKEATIKYLELELQILRSMKK